MKQKRNKTNKKKHPEENWHTCQRGGRSREWMWEVWVSHPKKVNKKKLSLRSVADPAPASLPRLVEEDVSRLWVLGNIWGKSVELLDGLGVDFLHDTGRRWSEQRAPRRTDKGGGATHLHYVVVEQKPEAVALHYGDVMTSVGATEVTGGEKKKRDLILQKLLPKRNKWL